MLLIADPSSSLSSRVPNTSQESAIFCVTLASPVANGNAKICGRFGREPVKQIQTNKIDKDVVLTHDLIKW